MKVFIIHQVYESMNWGVYSSREKAEHAMKERGGDDPEEFWPQAENLYICEYTVDDCDD